MWKCHLAAYAREERLEAAATDPALLITWRQTSEISKIDKIAQMLRKLRLQELDQAAGALSGEAQTTKLTSAILEDILAAQHFVAGLAIQIRNISG